jgi:hypothetical protein
VVFLASRGGKGGDTVSAAGTTAVTESVTATTAVRVIEFAETVPPLPPSESNPPTAAVAPTPAPTTPAPTTQAPTTVKPTTTAKPKPTTTVTTLPTTTVLDTAPPASAPPSTLLADPGVTTTPERMQEGRGTFHRYDNTDPQWGDHPCAHRTLPKGTVVTVVNTRTGASTWCVVKDRGPYGNAIIDLDEEQFVEIAPVAAGVINVRITW